MRFPPWLYKFTSQTHEGSQPIESISRRVDQTANAAGIVNNVYTVPGDFMFCLSNGVVAVDAPALVTPTQALLSFTKPDTSTEIMIAWNQTPSAAAENMTLNWSGEVWIPPGSVIHGVGSFDVANANNTVQAAIHGILIPRGSFSWS